MATAYLFTSLYKEWNEGSERPMCVKIVIEVNRFMDWSQNTSLL